MKEERKKKKPSKSHLVVIQTIVVGQGMGMRRKEIGEKRMRMESKWRERKRMERKEKRRKRGYFGALVTTFYLLFAIHSSLFLPSHFILSLTFLSPSFFFLLSMKEFFLFLPLTLEEHRSKGRRERFKRKVEREEEDTF